MHAQFGIRLVVHIGWSLCAEQLVARVVAKVVAKSVARVVPKVIAKVVAVRGKMHAQFWVSCSDCGGRFARGSVLPRLLSSWLLPGMLPRLLPFRCQGLCQDRCCFERRDECAVSG